MVAAIPSDEIRMGALHRGPYVRGHLRSAAEAAKIDFGQFLFG
jgi:hypothetical protein